MEIVEGLGAIGKFDLDDKQKEALKEIEIDVARNQSGRWLSEQIAESERR